MTGAPPAARGPAHEKVNASGLRSEMTDAGSPI